MDLLYENYNNKNKKTKGQKIILVLLVLSVVLFVVVTVLLFIMKKNEPVKGYTIEINGREKTPEDLGLLEEFGEKYISLKALCTNLEYQYYNGEYNIAGENKDKGYIDNAKNIIQFFANKSEIYKTEENADKDYEHYRLKNNIKQYDDTLYINLNDLNVALNLIQYFGEKDNKTTIQTPEYWLEQNNKEFENLGYKISTSKENVRLQAYGYVVVENNNKYGVTNLNGEEVIGNKYNDIVFTEYTSKFIVSNNNNKYGIINMDGTMNIDMLYDSIEILNYEPLLYKVKKQNDFGIMKEDGTIINEIKYTSLGYPKNEEQNIYYTLIIPEINNSISKTIVVDRKGQYGLIDLETGAEIVPCTLNGIFLIVDRDTNEQYYVAKFNDGSVNTLENYINSLNKV